VERKKCNLLIVDDDVALATMLEEYLSEANYEVQVCHHGDVALELLKRKAFDLILSDIRLPGANGLSILKNASSNAARTLVILMTGFSEIEEVFLAVEQGAYDYVSKPFQLPEILVRLDNAVRYQHLLRRLLEKKDSPLTFPQSTQISENRAVRVYGAQVKKAI